MSGIFVALNKKIYNLFTSYEEYAYYKSDNLLIFYFYSLKEEENLCQLTLINLCRDLV